jgi:hypothetical protein
MFTIRNIYPYAYLQRERKFTPGEKGVDQSLDG